VLCAGRAGGQAGAFALGGGGGGASFAIPAAPDHADAVDGLIRIRSALKLYFSLLAVSVVGVVAVLANAPEVPVELATSVAFSAVVLVWCGVSDPRAVLRLLKPARPVWYPVAVVTAAVTLAVAFGVVETLHRALGVPKLGYSQPFLDAGYGVWLVVLVVCVQPAVFEELAFRGVMLSGCGRR
jgi:membrane protease YdiL (CAAX protease family)